MNYIRESLNRYAPFFEKDPFDERHFTLTAKELLRKDFKRKELVSVLKDFNREFDVSRETFANIEALERDDVFCVVTGQQTGLFTGPLYTIYKTITAIKLARDIKEKWGINAVPVFWLPSEDRDFEEISNAVVINNKNGLIEIKTAIHESKDGFSYGADVREAVEMLASQTPETEFKQDIIHLLRECYDEGMPPYLSFGKMMARLFAGTGLIFAAQHIPEFKNMAEGIIKKEISSFSRSSEMVKDESAKMTASGLAPRIKLSRKALNLFYIDNGRKTIFIEDKKFRIGEKVFSEAELLSENPAKFSPNVVLRPIYEDFLLPVISYVAGPSEIAYYAQIKDVYDYFGVTMPLVFPRMNLLLLEKRNKELLEKFRLGIEDLEGGAEKIFKKNLSERQGGILEEFEKVRKNFEDVMNPFEEKITAMDPTLKDRVLKIKGTFSSNMAELEKRVLNIQKAKNETMLNQLERIRNSLAPYGMEQERVLNVTPFLIKYGPKFLERIFMKTDVLSAEKQVLEL